MPPPLPQIQQQMPAATQAAAIPSSSGLNQESKWGWNDTSASIYHRKTLNNTLDAIIIMHCRI